MIGITASNRLDSGSWLYNVWLYHKIKSEQIDQRKAAYIYMTQGQSHEYWKSRLSELNLPVGFVDSRRAVEVVKERREKESSRPDQDR